MGSAREWLASEPARQADANLRIPPATLPIPARILSLLLSARSTYYMEDAQGMLRALEPCYAHSSPKGENKPAARYMSALHGASRPMSDLNASRGSTLVEALVEVL